MAADITQAHKVLILREPLEANEDHDRNIEGSNKAVLSQSLYFSKQNIFFGCTYTLVSIFAEMVSASRLPFRKDRQDRE